MKRNYRLLTAGGLLILCGSLLIFPILKNKKTLPPPIQTRIGGEDEALRQSERVQWIEQMHRTAPGVNWRKTDQDYRLARANSNRAVQDLPIYGMWRELGSANQAGRTLFAYFDDASEEVFVAADGGQIWKGTIGTTDWQSINDNFRIGAIHFMRKVYANGEQRLLVGSGVWNTPGFLYTADEGQSWHTANGLEDVEGWGFVRRVVMPDTNTIYLLAQEWDYDEWEARTGIYKSTDLGGSFSEIATLPVNADFSDMWAKERTSVFILSANIVYTCSPDGQLTQVSAISGQVEGNTLLTGFEDGSDVYLYAMVRSDDQSYFYASASGGTNWQAEGSMDEGPFMVNSFKASIQQKDRLYFGGVNAYTSSDAGQTWQLVNQWYEYYDSPEDKLHADIPGFNSFLDENGDEFTFINTDGGMYISYDKVDNVQNLSLSGLRISQYYSTYTCRFDTRYTHAGAQDQGYQLSDEGDLDGLINYDQVISGDYGNIVSGDEGATVWMVYPGFTMFVGNAFTGGSLILQDFVGSNYQWLPKLMDDPDDPLSVYLAGGRTQSGAHIFHLHKSGSSISYSEMPYDFADGGDASLTALAYSPLNSDLRYALTSDQLFFYSTDGGDNWTQTPGFTGPESHYFYGAGIAPAKTETNTVFVGGSGYSAPAVFKSTDHGQTFTSYSDGLPNTLVFQLALSDNDSLLFAATEVGPFVCKTWEEHWYALSGSTAPDQSYWAVEYVPALKVARFSTYGRGVWDFELDPEITADFIADQVMINQGDTVNFTDSSQGNPILWEWYFEGAIPDTSTNQHPVNIVYNDAGSFDVRLIVHNLNYTDTLVKSDYITVMPSTIIVENNPHIQQLNIHPNPANDFLNVEMTSSVNDGILYFYSSDDRLMKQILVTTGMTDMRVDVSDLIGGVYIVLLKDGSNGKVQTGKAIIKH